MVMQLTPDEMMRSSDNSSADVVFCGVCLRMKRQPLYLPEERRKIDTCPECGLDIVGGCPKQGSCPKCRTPRSEAWASRRIRPDEEVKRNGICLTCQMAMKTGVVCIGVAGMVGDQFRTWGCANEHTFIHLEPNENVPSCPVCGEELSPTSDVRTISNIDQARTGRAVVLSEADVRELDLPDSDKDSMLKYRMALVAEDTWQRLGLPSK